MSFRSPTLRCRTGLTHLFVYTVFACSVLAGCSRQDEASLTAVSLPPSLNAGASLVLEQITVVDTRTGQLHKDRIVVIEDGKITGIGATGELSPPANAISVSASDKFLVPGYLDMHAHTAQWSEAWVYARLMLANGITGYRQMSGSDELLQQRNTDGIAPFPDAPALLAMPGAVLIGQLASTPEMTIAEVRKQQAEGADFIKVADLEPGVYMTALNKSTRLGLPYAGHLPSSIDVAAAADAGMRAVEHLGPRSSILINCSHDEAAIRHAIAESPPEGVPVLPDFVAWALQPVLKKVTARVLTNPILMGDDQEFALMQRLVDTYDDDKCRALAQTLADSPMWQVPTLIRVRTMEMGDAAEYRNEPNLKYVLQDDIDLWQSVGDEFAADITPANKQTLKAFFALQMQLVALFDQAGVKMLAGSDTAGAGWVIPGFSLHQEFDLLAEAGVSPLKVLQMTTLNGAEFLERTATMGTVEVGKEANLVLLDANPIDNVKNLHAIDAVVRNGNYYSKAALGELVGDS